MSKDTVHGLPIDNLLYTTEEKQSSEKTKGELAIPDPESGKALGILQGKEDIEKQKHEQKTS